jgi:maleate isomerase
MMRGLRGRIGVVHHWTAMMDHEFWELAPEGVSIFCTRLRGHPPVKDEPDWPALDMEVVQDACKDLVDCRPNSVIYACTSGSFGPGPKWNDLLIKTMEEATGAPATTNSQGVVKALEALGAKKVSVTTPYDDEYTSKLKVFLEAKGFTVTGIRRNPDVVHDYEKFLFPPEIAYRLAKDTFVRGSDAHFISCAGWRTLPIIERLEDDLGVPVISSVLAVMWHALKLAGVNAKMEGRGELFRI